MVISPLEQFCRSMFPRLVGVLGLYCGDRDAGEDLAQEALARACRDWRRVRAMDAPEAWVTRVGLNLAKSWGRRRTAARKATARHGPTTGVGTLDPADRLAVQRAVAALPDRQRAAVVLRYFADMSVEQTAAVMKCAPGTVKALTSQGIAGLKHAGLIDSDEENDNGD